MIKVNVSDIPSTTLPFKSGYTGGSGRAMVATHQEVLAALSHSLVVDFSSFGRLSLTIAGGRHPVAFKQIGNALKPRTGMFMMRSGVW